jgi:hypothetical protein
MGSAGRAELRESIVEVFDIFAGVNERLDEPFDLGRVKVALVCHYLLSGSGALCARNRSLLRARPADWLERRPGTADRSTVCWDPARGRGARARSSTRLSEPGPLAAAQQSKGEPAQLVAQPLVVENELSDFVGKLGARPLAFLAASRHPIVLKRCRARRPDGVGRGTQLVGCHVAHGRGLAGGVGGAPGCAT